MEMWSEHRKIDRERERERWNQLRNCTVLKIQKWMNEWAGRRLKRVNKQYMETEPKIQKPL